MEKRITPGEMTEAALVSYGLYYMPRLHIMSAPFPLQKLLSSTQDSEKPQSI